MEILRRGTADFWRSACRNVHLRHPRKALPRPNKSRSNSFPRSERVKSDPRNICIFHQQNRRKNSTKPQETDSRKCQRLRGPKKVVHFSGKILDCDFHHPRNVTKGLSLCHIRVLSLYCSLFASAWSISLSSAARCSAELMAPTMGSPTMLPFWSITSAASTAIPARIAE